MSAELEALARQAGQALAVRGFSVATAESCTGGWIAKLLTDSPGSSAWFERGFVVYSNAAKQELLGVPAATLGQHGAVSKATVMALASGALQHSHATVAIAVSGIAGPGGGSPDKPVGTVWLAWALREQVTAECHLFAGEREAVRRQAVAAALTGLIQRLETITLTPDGTLQP